MPRPKLAGKLVASGAKPPTVNTEPLWKGPSSDHELGGVSQSMLGRFIVCRERFRLYAIKGLRPVEQFQARIEYGHMWHACEEALGANLPWAGPLLEYGKQLCERYPTSKQQIEQWYQVCKVQFPIYIEHWKKHRDVVQRTPLAQELVFDVKLPLPSGRVVRLRGKMDGLDLIGPKTKAKVYIQENKTKSEIDQHALGEQLKSDLQNIFYVAALRRMPEVMSGKPLGGIRYNCIKRPLSGGKGSIKMLKATKNKPAETKKAYYERLGKIIAGDPETFFKRWKIDLVPSDINQWEQRILIPHLEQLCDWWEYMEYCDFEPWSDKVPLGQTHRAFNSIHYQHPQGVYNIVDEGGQSDVEEYLYTGSMAGLRTVDTLFSELQ